MLLKDIAICNPKNLSVNGFETINYIDTASVLDGKISKPELLNSNFPSRAQRIVKQNDILISSVRPNLKHNCIARELQDNTIASTGFILVRINTKNVLPRYLYYFLNAEENIAYYVGIAESSQSTFPSFNKEVLENLEIPNISLPEQQHIVNILGSIDDKIENNEKINQSYLKYLNAFFEKLSCKLNCFEDCEKEQIANLPHLLETGRRPHGGVGSFKSGVPSIGAENIKQIGVYDFSKTKYIPIDFADSIKSGRVNGYEILLYKDGGKPGDFTPHFSMFGEQFPYVNCFVNEHVFILDFSERWYNCFVLFYLQQKETIAYLKACGGKAAIPGINQENILKLLIPKKENVEIKAFGNIAEKIIKKLLIRCNENKNLTELKQLYLKKFFC